MTNLKVDHFALHVRDLSASIEFFQKIFGLEIIERPNFDFEGAWLGLNNGMQLHLLKFDDPIISGTRLCHFAFSAETDFQHFISLCNENGYGFLPPRVRPDGKEQLFILEPNGWYIEINKI
jgi:lactoylglutathione lyase